MKFVNQLENIRFFNLQDVLNLIKIISFFVIRVDVD